MTKVKDFARQRARWWRQGYDIYSTTFFLRKTDELKIKHLNHLPFNQSYFVANDVYQPVDSFSDTDSFRENNLWILMKGQGHILLISPTDVYVD